MLQEVNPFMVLKPLSSTVQRLRSKAFSLVCLFRFSVFLALIPIVIQSPGERDRMREKLGIRSVLWFAEGLERIVSREASPRVLILKRYANDLSMDGLGWGWFGMERLAMEGTQLISHCHCTFSNRFSFEKKNEAEPASVE